ncbi:MAG TPA: YdeI/OmpD-associated family protein [bacterium]|nr:YdeI/OmpD-associated family protein [bacterium]
MSPVAKKKAEPKGAPKVAAKAASDVAPDGGAIRAYATAKDWSVWLKKHHAVPEGVWIRFFKKGSGVPTITYAEALDEALCWGWIDGHVRALDEQSWIHRFTPRRPRSSWSKLNREHVARLGKAGRMTPRGLAQVAAAKADGRWDRAYESPSSHTIPDDFLQAVAQDKKTKAFFMSLNRANLYAISYRLQTAKKPETRERRFAQILAMLKEGKKFH